MQEQAGRERTLYIRRSVLEGRVRRIQAGQACKMQQALPQIVCWC